MLEKEYLTSREVAQKLKVARYRIYEWVRDDKIPYLRTVGRILFDPSEIERWLRRERRRSRQKAMGSKAGGQGLAQCLDSQAS